MYEYVLQIMLWGGSGGDTKMSRCFRDISCVVFFALSVHPPDFTKLSPCVCMSVTERRSPSQDTMPRASPTRTSTRTVIAYGVRYRTSTVQYSSRLCFEMGCSMVGDSPIS